MVETQALRSRQKRFVVLISLTLVLLALTLSSAIIYTFNDENSTNYFAKLHEHPVVARIKEYQGYASGKLTEYIDSIGNSVYSENSNTTTTTSTETAEVGTEGETVEEKIKVYEDNREDATLFSLVRNSDLEGILSSIGFVESRFNHQFHYDWIFVNDQEFTQEFQDAVSEKVSGRAIFSKIPEEFWSYPEWIDKEKAAEARKNAAKQKIKYGASQSYRHMCRFNSGFFYKMDVLKPYDYYWRVEPDIEFRCDINYDPFKVMRENGKKYGFNMAMGEFAKTVPTLWSTTKEFFEQNPMLVADANNIKFISDDEGETYNLCHFWSNFEIGSLAFFRSAEYQQFFDHLDHAGGFFYERWGDAPVHTLAVSMMLPLSELQYFDNTGYYHVPNSNCPPQPDIRRDLNCQCKPQKDFTWHKWSCVSKFFLVNEIELPEGVKPNHSKRDLLELDDWTRQDVAYGEFEHRWSD